MTISVDPPQHSWKQRLRLAAIALFAAIVTFAVIGVFLYEQDQAGRQRRELSAAGYNDCVAQNKLRTTLVAFVNESNSRSEKFYRAQLADPSVPDSLKDVYRQLLAAVPAARTRVARSIPQIACTR